MALTPRLSPPTDFSTWYGSNNNWNRFSRDYGNCTWYAYGRTGEIANKNIYDEFYITQPPGNGKDWIYNTWQQYTHTSGAVDLQVGDILVWGGGRYGHVEVVEEILTNTIAVSYSLAAVKADYTPDYDKSLYWGIRYIPKNLTWGDYLGNVEHNDGTTAYLYNTFIGYIHNPYADQPTPGVKTPTISLSPLTGTITDSGIVLEITADYIPYYEDNPEPLREMSSGLTRTWITPWQITTHTEDDNEYQRVYGVMRINADNTAPNPSYVRFYQNYYTGSVSITGTYNVQITDNIIPILAKWLQKKRKKRFTIIRRI